jgi:hypothetical protein
MMPPDDNAVPFRSAIALNDILNGDDAQVVIARRQTLGSEPGAVTLTLDIAGELLAVWLDARDLQQLEDAVSLARSWLGYHPLAAIAGAPAMSRLARPGENLPLALALALAHTGHRRAARHVRALTNIGFRRLRALSRAGLAEQAPDDHDA